MCRALLQAGNTDVDKEGLCPSGAQRLADHEEKQTPVWAGLVREGRSEEVTFELNVTWATLVLAKLIYSLFLEDTPGIPMCSRAFKFEFFSPFSSAYLTSFFCSMVPCHLIAFSSCLGALTRLHWRLNSFHMLIRHVCGPQYWPPGTAFCLLTVSFLNPHLACTPSCTLGAQ